MTNNIVILDGQKIQLLKDDLNKDGKISEVEILSRDDYSKTLIQEPTELGESLKELNFDGIEKDTRMSGIDMRARLHYIEVPAILAIDTLVSFSFLPISCLAFTRQKKRLSVSINGQGRQEIVELVAGKKEHEERKGMMGVGERLKNALGGN